MTKHMLPREAEEKLQRVGGRVVHVPTDAVGRVTYRLYEDHSRALFALWKELAHAGHPDAILETHTSSKEEAWIGTPLEEADAAVRMAAHLRDETFARLGFVVSVGVARCKAYAKLASLAAKPPACGVHVALAGADVAMLLERTPVSQLRMGSLSSVQRDTLERAPPSGAPHGNAPCIANLSALSERELARLLTPVSVSGRAPLHGAAEAIDEEKRRLLADELLAFASGQYAERYPDAVRSRPPRQAISAACSLLAERRERGGGVDGADSIEPICCASDDEVERGLEKWVRSCAVDVLQRSALHWSDHQLSPAKLELALDLVDRSSASSSPLLHSSTSCDLDRRVVSAIRQGALRYRESEEDEQSAAERQRGVDLVVVQVRALARRLLAKARELERCPMRAACVKKITLTLKDFGTPGGAGAVDIREALLGGLAPGEDRTGRECDDVHERNGPGGVDAVAERAGTSGEAELVAAAGGHASTLTRPDPAAGWFVSLRAVADALEGSTPSRIALEAAMQKRLVAALAARWPDAAEAAYPLLCDQAVLMRPLPSEQLTEAALHDLHLALRPSSSGAASPSGVCEPAFISVGVGAARVLSVALLAASTAMHSTTAGGVIWARAPDEVERLLLSRPCSSLLPALRVDEWVGLASEGVQSCLELCGVDTARCGASRVAVLKEAATRLLPSLVAPDTSSSPEAQRAAAATPSRAAGKRKATGPPPMEEGRPVGVAATEGMAGARGMAGVPGLDGALSGWDLPSCSQIDPQTVAEIGGAAGDELRREYERRQQERSAAVPSAAASASTSVGHHGPDGSWTCAACTFVHRLPAERDFLSCTVCGTTRAVGTFVWSTGAPPPPALSVSPSRTSRAAGGDGARGGAGASGKGGAGGRTGQGRSAARGAGPRRSPFERPSGRYWPLAPPADSAAIADGADAGAALQPRVAASRSLAFDRGGGPSGGVAPPSPSRSERHSSTSDAPALLETWDEMRPHIAAWLAHNSTPDASLLLAYAHALIDVARLDELGCLARFLQRQCAGRAIWHPMLHAFVEGVDEAVLAKYGGRLEPLRGIRALLCNSKQHELADEVTGEEFVDVRSEAL